MRWYYFMKKKKLLILPTILLFIIAFVLITDNLISNNQDIRSKAAGETGYCLNNCIGEKDPCSSKKIGDNYYDEACCSDIKKTGDPFACGNWVNRVWCFEDECSTIPADVNRQRCGGARWSYCEKCKEQGCYLRTKTPTSTIIPPTIPIPTITLIPTLLPSPTQAVATVTNIPVPTSISASPTSVPAAQPTIRIFVPTVTVVSPSLTPAPTNIPRLKKISHNINGFIRKTKELINRFIYTILP